MEMIFLKFSILCMALGHASADLGFLDSCYDDGESICIPEAGCAFLNTYVTDDPCGENLKCCELPHDGPGSVCALSPTTFGHCVDVPKCRTSDSVQKTCQSGDRECCPQDFLIETGNDCFPNAASCVLSGNCKSAGSNILCETGSSCCATKDMPGLDEDCGLESPDQGTCINGTVARCAQAVLNGNLCQDGLICCAKPIPENLGKRCGSRGRRGTCQNQCCSGSTIDCDDCGSDELVCCVPGLGMDCRLSNGDLSKCIFKKDCEKPTHSHNQLAKKSSKSVERIDHETVTQKNRIWNQCRNPNLVCCP